MRFLILVILLIFALGCTSLPNPEHNLGYHFETVDSNNWQLVSLPGRANAAICNGDTNTFGTSDYVEWKIVGKGTCVYRLIREPVASSQVVEENAKESCEEKEGLELCLSESEG